MDQTSNTTSTTTGTSPHTHLLYSLSLIPTSHYLTAAFLLFLSVLYNFLELHFFFDFLSGFRGCHVGFTFHPSSPLFNGVVSHCKILCGRYVPTPWLCSPHLQTLFLHFFGRAPVFNYIRQLFYTSDGGTIALDWLLSSNGGGFHLENTISKDDTTPIVVMIPGLTSDSSSAYIKHYAISAAKRGWNVVVSNHRGLGGVSVTSDCFYNAGWTEDVRAIVNYLHEKYPKAPLFAVGTSIGANILVKYLGEEAERTPVAGAAAICSPWDLLIGDRFICRRLVQKLYDRALAIGLQGYAQLHEPRYSRLANWEGISKSKSIRDFDNHATCLVGKYETVDTYYRRNSSAPYVVNVSVPLLCISALDDPVCTREAIPWDECRANPNVVLATADYGGHLAFFEGWTASTLWWAMATDDFLGVLRCGPYMHVQKLKQQAPVVHSPPESSIDHAPYAKYAEDGMVAAMGSEQTRDTNAGVPENAPKMHQNSDAKQENQLAEVNCGQASETSQTSEQATAPVQRRLNQILRHSKRSMWLLAFIAFTTSWPLLGSLLNIIFRKKVKKALPQL